MNPPVTSSPPGLRPSRIIGEFVLIVAGVLSALAADGWRESRMETEQGREYAARLADDLRADIETWETAVEYFQEKRPSLRRLTRLDAELYEASTDQVAFDLFLAQGWAWGSINTNDATYQEMLSAGELNLLRDPRLRADIVAHYTTREGRMRSIDARRTEIGPLTYRLLVSRDDETEPEAWMMGITTVEFDHTFVDSPTPDELRAIRQAASAELDASVYAMSVALRLIESSAELLERLDALDPS